jgi:hypothetical protein
MKTAVIEKSPVSKTFFYYKFKYLRIITVFKARNYHDRNNLTIKNYIATTARFADELVCSIVLNKAFALEN